MSFSRGSEWRKWDLHVHTPKSIEQHYGGDTSDAWENFVHDIESLPEDIKVLGINDYIFLDGYKEVLKYKSQGRMSNIDLFLPVVELRIDKYGNLDDKAWKRVNLHIIFSDEISAETIESQFLNAIQVNYTLSPIDEFNQDSISFFGVITKESLSDLGKKIKKSATVSISGSDLKVGFSNFTHSYDQVKKALESHYFKDKFLLAVGKTEWDAMRWTGSVTDKKTIINEANFVFISTDSKENYEKSKEKLKNEGVNSYLLDCSDAHSFSSSDNKDKLGNTLTWIKANPTFEGLKQVIHEYEERVFIGEEPEVLKRVKDNRTKYVKELNIDKTATYNGSKGIWFDDISLKLNNELVAIIGNKGSGKSALSDIIALLGNSHKENHFSFLNTRKFKKKKLAENFNATLHYESGEQTISNLNDNSDINGPERVRYLPQNYFEELCNDLEGEGFEKALKKVVFSHLPDEQKLGTDSFDELIDIKTNIINEDIKTIIPKISNINQEIIKLENHKLSSFKEFLQNNYELKFKELFDHKKNRPIKIANPSQSGEVDEEQEKLIKSVNEKKAELEQKENILKSYEQTIKIRLIEVSELNTLKSDFERLITSINEFRQSKQELLDKYTLEFDALLKINSDLSKIDETIKTKNEEVSRLKKEILSESENQRTGLKVDIENIKEFITITEKELSKPEQEYRKYLSEFNSWKEKSKEIIGDEETTGTLKYYRGKLKYIENDLDSDLNQKREERINLSLEIYDKKFEIVEVFKSLKETIDITLNQYTELLSNYNIAIDATYKLNSFEIDFFKFIKQNKMGSFYGSEEGKVKLREIIETKNLDLKEDFKDILEELITYLEVDKREDREGEARIIVDQVDNIETFYSYLFNLDYLLPNYELKLDNKNLVELSPGEKGALLLVFYLMLDKEEIPLIIDQPEDNLDNQSVYKIVVKFIKLAKKRRQIIMVTHNPNLAVVADAEQIIYASIDKQDNNRFTVKSGAIEDSEINQCIVDILEGTRPAFDKRSYKYFK